jgi:hypothetical protein
MSLEKTDGSILKFLTIEPIDTSSGSTPSYTTYQGVYYEEKESIDGFAYLYVTFVKDSIMQFLKFTVSDLKI